MPTTKWETKSRSPSSLLPDPFRRDRPNRQEGSPPTGDLFRPKRFLGQNFLVDRRAQERIVRALGAGAEDDVVELGPGRGALTQHLIGRVRRLRLVELDRRLAAEWRRVLADRDGSTVTVVEGDMLEKDLHHAFPEPEAAFVIGNLPYNITSPVIFRLLERPRPRAAVLTVQAEVAERLTAHPGAGPYGALSVGVQAVADCRLLFRLPPGAFHPRPKVRSAVVRVSPIKPPPLSEYRERSLRKVVRASFSWRRKQLGRTLARHPDLALGRSSAAELLGRLGIAPDARPETLSPPQFIALADQIDAAVGPLPAPVRRSPKR